MRDLMPILFTLAMGKCWFSLSKYLSADGQEVYLRQSLESTAKALPFYFGVLVIYDLYLWFIVYNNFLDFLAFFMGRIGFWLGGLSPIFMIPAFRKKFMPGRYMFLEEFEKEIEREFNQCKLNIVTIFALNHRPELTPALI